MDATVNHIWGPMRGLSVFLLLGACTGAQAGGAPSMDATRDAAGDVPPVQSADGGLNDASDVGTDVGTDTGMEVAVRTDGGGMTLDGVALRDAASGDGTGAERDAVVAPDAGGPGRTTLRVHYPSHPGGMALRGSGEGLTWDHGVPFAVGADSTWTWSSDTLTAPIEWKPLLGDATWSRGPNYRVSPGSTLDVWPHFTTIQGGFSRRWPAFMSAVLGNTRGVWVYLPPSYTENPTARFPVVYMQDGQNLFDPAAAFGGVTWQVAQTLDAAAEDGSIREAIVIGVENNSARIDEYTPTRDAMTMAGGHGDLYLRMLLTELKPQVDRELRTLPGPADTVLAGSSLGALISLYGGIHHADVFGLVGALSPSTWWDNNMILREVPMVTALPSRPGRVYIDSGDSGPSNDDVDLTRMLAAAWRAVGYADGSTLDYTVQPGGMHSETYWSMRFPGAMHFLLGARQP